MHNNIMAAGSKDRPPMLGPGRYSQWRSPRLVSKGSTQTNGVDYGETFSPVADIRAIRILVAIAAAKQSTTAMASIKVEYIDAAEVSMEAVDPT
ncbi:putative retrotransposon ty1-copia subclass protein [Tanacetum coccineum]